MSPTACDTPRPRILAVTGVGREAKIAAGPGVETLCSGGSPVRLRDLLAGHDPAGLAAVVSFGIAGGLDPALPPGAVVVGTEIITEQGRLGTDPALRQSLTAALGSTSIGAAIAGADVALVDVAMKAALRQRSGAAVVDMESHIAASYAATHSIPFAAIRVVCDPADHGLPPLVGEALTPQGDVSLLGVLGSLLRHPGQIPALLRLARQSGIAFGALNAAAPALRAIT